MKKRKYYIIVILISFGLTCLTLIMPNLVDSREDLAIQRYGLPFSFIEQESTLTPPDDWYPAFVTIGSPFEYPTRFRPLYFLIDFIVLMQIVIAVINILKYQRKGK